MHLLLSGEGKSDIGVCNFALDQCDADNFQPGPMSWMVDQLIEASQGYEFSHLENGCVSFVSESYLALNKPPVVKKSMSLPGKKKQLETKYYFENARALAIAATRKSKQIGDVVIAVLFHDSDGTASAGRGDWEHKRKSMQAGFATENFDFGVAMMPKPKSEAWLLCAVKENPYQHCQKIEEVSGNDKAQRPLKEQLADALQGADSTEQLNDLLRTKKVDVSQINMNSFNVFKDELDKTVKKALSCKLTGQ
ncbi:MAG: hypothetical protein RIR39_2353 [Pseudomonadota bacterium]